MSDHENAPRGATSLLALSCVGFIASATPAHAQAARPVEEKSAVLGGMTVTDTVIEDRVKVERAENPKYTRPLLDLPQTITVIGAQTIRQQNLLTLREVLGTVPGITFGAGEGGFGYGDRINLRGYSANNDITVDGVRSGAVLSRNETYNIEQIEVTNGANSVVNGGGSVGGTINLVTKRPTAENTTVLNAGIGTDNYYRATVDSNVRLNELIAVRLNAVYHENDIPGRQVENNKRWGVAPAIRIGIDGPTSLTFQYEHLDDESLPQYGIPYFATLGGVIPDINREGYYGFRNVDTQKSKTNSLQAIFAHRFSDTVSIRNLTRYENIRQYTVTSQPAGTFCLDNGLTSTGGACTVAISTAPARNLTIPAGYYLPTGGRGTTRHIRNQTAYNQTDLTAVVNTFGAEHTLVLGASALWEKYALDSGNILRAADGSNPFAAPGYYPLTSIANPNGVIVGPAATTGLARIYGSNVYTGPINYIRGAYSDGEQTSYAAYLFDAVKITDWFELNGGMRYERFSGENVTRNFSTAVATLGQPTTTTGPFRATDHLFSYRIGAVVKPMPNVSVYAAFGNSRTPSKASVDGSCALATCNTAPESAKNYEIGAKADVFDGGLQLAAALFRNERDKYRLVSGDPTIPDQVLDGKSRVDGIALSATGNIGEAFSIFANYTYLDSKVVRGVSRFCLANPGAGTCANSAAFPDPVAGVALQSTPKHSGSGFATYRLPFGLELGYGLTYQGSFLLNVPTLAQLAANNYVAYRVNDYVTHRLMVTYPVTSALRAQLNVQNFTNEKYVTTVRTATGNSWAQPGATRSAVLSLFYTF
ncbi:TonB-dependent receptor [Sphingomonas solaris]|uniref:TonB-dependent siderophore receptor n=1 Tax=Alterirhizorhabdus solaris TaxID=2529389 RepID=A0A558QTJ7_9SPHN|nr:TonB-dependent receptor [Sphingomonas solaris]TVV70454.1 TonB-dependent siderophore receptor [Sphingomonas solaris]